MKSVEVLCDSLLCCKRTEDSAKLLFYYVKQCININELGLTELQKLTDIAKMLLSSITTPTGHEVINGEQYANCITELCYTRDVLSARVKQL